MKSLFKHNAALEQVTKIQNSNIMGLNLRNKDLKCKPWKKNLEKELRKEYVAERRKALGNANLEIVFVTFQDLDSSSKVFSAFKLNTIFQVNKKLKPKQPDVPLQPEVSHKHTMIYSILISFKITVSAPI